jgi:RNA polymerase sigma-70 factor (ECF subfamily)
MFDRDKLNQLYRYGLSLTGDEQLAYDLVHDTVEKLISKNFILNKMAYAKKSMRNRFYDILKSKSNSATVSIIDDEFSSEDNTENIIDATNSIREVMKGLKTSERELLYLWGVEEYSTKEISELMNLPKGTVTSKLKRLRDKLQKDSGGRYG